MCYDYEKREQERKNLVDYICEQTHCDEDSFDRGVYLSSVSIEEYVEYRIKERLEENKL